MKKTHNRWLILIVSIVSQVIVGSAYAWGVINPPLRDLYGFSATQVGFAFSLALGLMPPWMILAGKISPKIGVNTTILIGGLLQAAGFILLSQFISEDPTTIFIFYGVFSSLGIGIVYGTAVPNVVKWFPDKRGLAGGLIVGGFGGGAVLFAPIFTAVMNALGSYEVRNIWVPIDGVMTLGSHINGEFVAGADPASVFIPGIESMFLYFGIIFAIAAVLAFFLIKSPPEGYKPEGWNPPAVAPGAVGSTVNLSPGEMIKTLNFWLLFGMFTFCMVGGIMILGQIGSIGVTRIGLASGGALLATAVLAQGLGNTFGRVVWGGISDKIGRSWACVCMNILTILGLILFLMTGADDFAIFVIAAVLVVSCFGGFAGTYPAITADNFGPANMAVNYGIIFFGFGISAFVGPNLAGAVIDATGTHDLAFMLSIVFSVIAMVLTFILMARMNNAKKVVS